MPSEGFQWGALGAAIAALITGIVTWAVQRNRGRVDETIAAVGEWQKLTSNLAAANEALRAELVDSQKAWAVERAELLRDKEAEIKALRVQNENLIRIITQNSSSRAQLVGGIDTGSGGK